MNATQRALQFACQGHALVGIIDVPDRPLARGVLVIAGAGEHRIGKYRHFTLLARMLAGRGIPVMRFDQRGIGDSEGEGEGKGEGAGNVGGGADARDADIRAAMKEFFMQMPEMKEIVILGLGEAAAAASVFAQSDSRIKGVILLNPEVHEDGAKPAHLSKLLARFGELAFWKKLAAAGQTGASAAQRHAIRAAVFDPGLPLAQRVLASLASFDGAVLVILGGDDAAARDCADLLARHVGRCKCVTIAGADHTFASRVWRDDVAEASANWIVSW